MTAANRKLRGFLETRGVSQSAAARALGVTSVAVHQWVHGRARPRPDLRVAIERWTRGFLRADEWQTAREKDRARFALRVAPLEDGSA